MQEGFKMASEDKFIKMTTTPIPKLVVSLAVPTIISMLVTSFYNMVDTYFVGKINTEATAAVGVVFSMMAVIQALGFTFGHGSGTLLARKLGERENEEAERVANAGFFFSIICGICVTVLGLCFLRPLSYFLGATDNSIDYVMDYMRIILIGAPFIMSSFVLNNQLRYQGRAMFSMIGILIGAVLNLILDPLLIFTFQMDIKGAAYATIIGQIVSFIVLLFLTHNKGNIPITLKRNPFVMRLFFPIFSAGVPSLFRQGLASISVMLLNRTIGSVAGTAELADAAIAGMSIVSRITMFANSALIGFGQGFQPVCSYNYGAKLYGRVREAFWFCVKVAAVFLLGVSLVGIFGAEFLVQLIRKDDIEVMKIGVFALRAQATTFTLGAWIVMCNMMLQACGQSLMASIVASCRQGVCLIPLLLTLPYFMGVTGVQIAQPISDVITLIVSLVFGLYFLNKMKKMETVSVKTAEKPEEAEQKE